MDYQRLIAWALPMFVVYAVGITLAIVNLSRHPRPAIMVLVACAVMLVTTVASKALFYFGGLELYRGDAYLVVTVVTTLIHASGWAVVLVAAFTGRRESGPAAIPLQ